MGGKGIGYFVDHGMEGFRGFIKPSTAYPIQTLHRQINTLLRPKPAPRFVAYCIKAMEEVAIHWKAAEAEAKRLDQDDIPQLWLDNRYNNWTLEEAYEAIQVVEATTTTTDDNNNRQRQHHQQGCQGCPRKVNNKPYN